VETLKVAIRGWEEVIASPRFGRLTNEQQVAILAEASARFHDRYQYLKDPADLTRALSGLRTVISLLPTDHQRLPGYLSNLATTLVTAFQGTNKVSHLNESIERYHQAIAIGEQQACEPVVVINKTNLAKTLILRYLISGSLKDLEESIALCWEGLARLPLDAHHFRLIASHNLATALYARYERLNGLEDLEESIKLWQECIDSPHTNDFLRALSRGNLATGLSSFAFRTYHLPTLDRAIEEISKAIDDMLPTSIELPDLVCKLGNFLNNKYVFTREIRYLDEAIKYAREAVRLSSTGQAFSIYNALGNLCDGLLMKSYRTGELGDLDEARVTTQRAIQTCGAYPSAKSKLQYILSRLMMVRYRATGDLSDIDLAITFAREGAESLDHTYKLLGLSLTAALYGLRYLKTESEEDLKWALIYYYESLKSLNNMFCLSNTSYQLAQQRKEYEVCEMALAMYLNALAVWPEQAPFFSRESFTLVEGLKSRVFTHLLRRSKTLLHKCSYG